MRYRTSRDDVELAGVWHYLQHGPSLDMSENLSWHAIMVVSVPHSPLAMLNSPHYTGPIMQRLLRIPLKVLP